MRSSLLLYCFATLFLGCSSMEGAAPVGDSSVDRMLKKFPLPPGKSASIYFYRADTIWGSACTGALFVDGEEVGFSAAGYYSHTYAESGVRLLSADQLHQIPIKVEAGETYFYEVFVKADGSCDLYLKRVDDSAGTRGVSASKYSGT